MDWRFRAAPLISICSISKQTLTIKKKKKTSCATVYANHSSASLEAACDANTQLPQTAEFSERRVTAQGELKQVHLMSYFTPHFSPLMNFISMINIFLQALSDQSLSLFLPNICEIGEWVILAMSPEPYFIFQCAPKYFWMTRCKMGFL